MPRLLETWGFRWLKPGMVLAGVALLATGKLEISLELRIGSPRCDQARPESQTQRDPEASGARSRKDH